MGLILPKGFFSFEEGNIVGASFIHSYGFVRLFIFTFTSKCESALAQPPPPPHPKGGKQTYLIKVQTKILVVKRRHPEILPIKLKIFHRKQSDQGRKIN